MIVPLKVTSPDGTAAQSAPNVDEIVIDENGGITDEKPMCTPAHVEGATASSSSTGGEGGSSREVRVERLAAAVTHLLTRAREAAEVVADGEVGALAAQLSVLGMSAAVRTVCAAANKFRQRGPEQLIADGLLRLLCVAPVPAPDTVPKKRNGKAITSLRELYARTEAVDVYYAYPAKLDAVTDVACDALPVRVVVWDSCRGDPSSQYSMGRLVQNLSDDGLALHVCDLAALEGWVPDGAPVGHTEDFALEIVEIDGPLAYNAVTSEEGALLMQRRNARVLTAGDHNGTTALKLGVTARDFLPVGDEPYPSTVPVDMGSVRGVVMIPVMLSSGWVDTAGNVGCCAKAHPPVHRYLPPGCGTLARGGSMHADGTAPSAFGTFGGFAFQAQRGESRLVGLTAAHCCPAGVGSQVRYSSEALLKLAFLETCFPYSKPDIIAAQLIACGWDVAAFLASRDTGVTVADYERFMAEHVPNNRVFGSVVHAIRGFVGDPDLRTVYKHRYRALEPPSADSDDNKETDELEFQVKRLDDHSFLADIAVIEFPPAVAAGVAPGRWHVPLEPIFNFTAESAVTFQQNDLINALREVTVMKCGARTECTMGILLPKCSVANLNGGFVIRVNVPELGRDVTVVSAYPTEMSSRFALPGDSGSLVYGCGMDGRLGKLLGVVSLVCQIQGHCFVGISPAWAWPPEWGLSVQVCCQDNLGRVLVAEAAFDDTVESVST